jgi:fatty-acyl-CoA synthase
MLIAHATSSAEFAMVSTPDSVVSWLPLFHDMGFVGGFVCPLVWNIPFHLLPTEAFLQDPTVWLRLISDKQATLTVTPPFALDLLARHAPDSRLQGVQLSQLRYMWVGSEPIHPSTLKAFAERFQPYGFARQALKPCYGLAEATLAVTLTPANHEYRTIAINRYELRADGTARPTGTVPSQVEFVSCGRRLPILEIQIIGPDGELLPDLRQGEVCVRGETVARAVVGSGTRAANGWHHTGDLGFRSEGEFFITGRRKDVIKRGGISLHPIELESVVEHLPDVRAGGAVAFSIILEGDKAERIVVVVESTGADEAAMHKAIRNAIVSDVGITIDEVVMVAPRTVPRTTSGKRMRQETRRMYEAGELDGVAK